MYCYHIIHGSILFQHCNMINHASLCPGHAFRKNCPQSNRNQGRCDTAIHGMKDDERLLGYWEQFFRSIVINLNIECMHAYMQLGLNSCTERALIRSWFDSLPIAYVHHAIMQYALSMHPTFKSSTLTPGCTGHGPLAFFGWCTQVRSWNGLLVLQGSWVMNESRYWGSD